MVVLTDGKANNHPVEGELKALSNYIKKFGLKRNRTSFLLNENPAKKAGLRKQNYKLT